MNRVKALELIYRLGEETGQWEESCTVAKMKKALKALQIEFEEVKAGGGYTRTGNVSKTVPCIKLDGKCYCNNVSYGHKLISLAMVVLNKLSSDDINEAKISLHQSEIEKHQKALKELRTSKSIFGVCQY